MRPFTIREEDGSAIAAVCDTCGAEIYEGGAYYRAGGRTVCPACLEQSDELIFVRMRGG